MTSVFKPDTTGAPGPTNVGLACDLSAIATDEREAHLGRATRLTGSDFQERRTLPDGIAWRLTADDYDDVWRFVANERRCCPFFTFSMEVTPYSGPLWLRITGDAAVVSFLHAEFAAQSAPATDAAAAPATPPVEEAIACVPSVLAAGELSALETLSKDLLLVTFQERHELPNGYAWRFAADRYDQLTWFVDRNRRCCPFYTHTLEVTPHGGPLWLRITGSNAVKAELCAELDRLQSEQDIAQ